MNIKYCLVIYVHRRIVNRRIVNRRIVNKKISTVNTSYIHQLQKEILCMDKQRNKVYILFTTLYHCGVGIRLEEKTVTSGKNS